MAYTHGQTPEWAGVALRYPGGSFVTFQIHRPHAVVEFRQEWDRSEFHDYPVISQPSRKFYKIELEGETWDWGTRADGSLYVPAAEIEARREIER